MSMVPQWRKPGWRSGRGWEEGQWEKNKICAERWGGGGPLPGVLWVALDFRNSCCQEGQACGFPVHCECCRDGSLNGAQRPALKVIEEASAAVVPTKQKEQPW